jgi:predicted AAA+ superfamily ATPase
VVRRSADPWRPADAQESFEIVRRRLFTAPTASALADISAVGRQFCEFYAKNPGEFPREVVDPAYEDRIKRAYPFHPELFDRLYQDWSTLERFQRTRGVLRLMSTVVHALWSAQDAAPMILPGTPPPVPQELRCTDIAEGSHHAPRHDRLSMASVISRDEAGGLA